MNGNCNMLEFKVFTFHVFTEITLLDEKGNKTPVPNKERQLEALQLLFMLLPPANRSLLKLLLDLLYQTAKQQDKNKMSAFNLALMFAPHIIWPKNVGVGPFPLFSDRMPRPSQKACLYAGDRKRPARQLDQAEQRHRVPHQALAEAVSGKKL